MKLNAREDRQKTQKQRLAVYHISLMGDKELLVAYSWHPEEGLKPVSAKSILVLQLSSHSPR